MKTLVITGGSDGIGKAIAEYFAAQYHVVLLARNETALKAIAKKTGCTYYVCDVRDAAQVQQTFQQIVRTHKTVDILINNAGVIVNGDLVDMDYADITNTLNTNTLGAIYVAKAALTAMKKQRSGYIINVISQAGITARVGRSIYNASKWAITGFTKALQLEAAEYGVRVTGFYPGTVKTQLFAKAGIPIKTTSLEVAEAVKAVAYLLSLDEEVLVPELGLKHLNN